MSHEFTQCDPYNKMDAFFYYDHDLDCNMSLSDPLPNRVNDVNCTHVCPADGQFANFTVFTDKNGNETAEFRCTECPRN